jgi:hypothetical protein
MLSLKQSCNPLLLGPAVKASVSLPKQATKDLFDEEGYVMTGDVMELREGETFVWLDRVKNVIKLSQG